jgi:hypothetical protein
MNLVLHLLQQARPVVGLAFLKRAISSWQLAVSLGVAVLK